MTGEKEEDKSNNPFGLERSSEQGLRLVSSESLLKRGLNSISALDQILRFPDNNTNCAGFSYETGSSLVDWFEFMETWLGGMHEPLGVQCHGLPRGPFKCPEGKELILVLNGEVEPSLKILAGLHSNSVTGLLLLSGFSNPNFQYDKHFKGLKCISIVGNDVDDETLSHLVKLESLQYLDLRHSAVTDSGLAQLSNLRHLTHLNLEGSAVTDSGLAQLSNSRHLTDLNLFETNVTGEFVERMPHIKNTLRELFISGPMVTDDTLGYISQLKALSLLSVESEHITGYGAALLKDVSSLVTLSLTGSNITDIDLNGLELLASLSLGHTGIGDVDLKGLSSLPNLNYLNLMDTKLGDRAMDAVSSIQSLTDLNLEGTSVTEKSIESLSELKSLRYLRFRDTPMAEAGYEILENRFPDSVILYFERPPHFQYAPMGRGGLWDTVNYYSQRLS